MLSLSRILVFIQCCTVKTSQSKLILRKMCRYPVQNNANAMIMHIIHKIHEVRRCTVSGCRSIIAGYLIAPGTIKRMLRKTDQLHMRITHFQNIIRQLHRQLLKIIKFSRHGRIFLP